MSCRNRMNIGEVSDEVDREVNCVCAKESHAINQCGEDGRICLDRSRCDDVITRGGRVSRRKGPKESEWDVA